MVQLGLLERDADQPQMLVQRLGELKDTTREIQDNLHRLAVDLRPASLDHVGLVTALQQYVQDFREQYGLRIECEAVGMARDRLPTEVETAVFRIVQEAMTNVIRHAQATRVDIILSRRGNTVAATIEDDGVGFPFRRLHL
jgi:signal transduction histidine kinase